MFEDSTRRNGEISHTVDGDIKHEFNQLEGCKIGSDGCAKVSGQAKVKHTINRNVVDITNREEPLTHTDESKQEVNKLIKEKKKNRVAEEMLTEESCENGERSLLKFKKKRGKKSQNIEEFDNSEQKSKLKPKSKLSLNSEVKSKNKFKEDNGQVTLISFFQKMSPKTSESNKNSEDTEELNPCNIQKLEDHLESCLVENESLKVAKKSIVDALFNAEKNCDLSKSKNLKNEEQFVIKVDTSCSEGSTENNDELLKETNGKIEKDRTSRKKKKKSKEEKSLFENKSKEKIMTPKSKITKEKVIDNSNEAEELKKAVKEKKLQEEITEKSISSKSKKRVKEKVVINSIEIKKLKKQVKEKKLQEEIISDYENQEEKLDEKELNKKVRFSEDIEEYSPEPAQKNLNDVSKNYESVKVTKKQLIVVDEEESSEDMFDKPPKVVNENSNEEQRSGNSEENTELSKNKMKNAFAFMMDNRYNSIGQNLTGKEQEKLEETPELQVESRKKLSRRKAIFEDWANKKGAKKRKIEDDEKGIVIENKLKKRAKRLKKMLTEKQSSENLNLDNSEDNSNIVKTKRHKLIRIIESDSECTRDAAVEEFKETNVGKAGEKEKRKRKAETEGKTTKQDADIVAVVDDLALDKEIFAKVKKRKLMVSSGSSSNECELISEEKLNNSKVNSKTPKNNVDALPLQQMELSSFFGIMNKTEKSDLLNQSKSKLQMKRKLKNKSKLQMKRKLNSFEENSKKRNSKKKDTVKSKLTLKKNEDSSITVTSDDFSNTHIETESLIEDESNSGCTDTDETKVTSGDKDDESSECRIHNSNGYIKENEIVLVDKDHESSEVNIHKEKSAAPTVMTPSTAKQWKMRLKMSLSDTDDEVIAKLMQPHVDDKATNSERALEDLHKTKLKNLVISSDSDSDNEPLSSRREKLLQNRSKNIKPLKLAPLFTKAKPKPQTPKLDEATIEARRKFLHSGIPEILKKVIEKQQRVSEVDYEIFPSVSHVTVKPITQELANSSINFWNLPRVNLKLTKCESYLLNVGLLKLHSFTSSTTEKSNCVQLQPLQKITNFKNHLEQIKFESPNYPVYKAFRFLYQKHLRNLEDEQKTNEKEEIVVKPTNKNKKSKKSRSKKKKTKNPADDVVEISDQPQISTKQQSMSRQELWTDLYKPCVSEEMFGNHASIFQLKTWLETWLEFSEEINSQRNRRNRRNSDSCSDFESTDAESRDTLRLPGNTTILCGPHGSGKTAAIYALCNELGINILEFNASSKRTGKRLLQELQEATQSHQVRKNDPHSLSTFLKRDETNSYTQNSQSSDSQSSTSSKKMCLLLIEDVDIVFEQDENFIAALSQLLSTSKRPLVLTTTDPNCLHLKKFFTQYSVIIFSALSARVLATWLQVVCLIENLRVDRQAIVELLERNKGDVRCTLLQLQFWVQSGGQLQVSENISTAVVNLDSQRLSVGESLCLDDSSNMSWLKSEEKVSEQKDISNKSIIHSNCLESFGYFKKRKGILTMLPLDLGEIWWSLSSLLNILPPLLHINKGLTNVKNNEKEKELKEGSSTQGELSLQPLATQNVLNVNKDLQNMLNIFETLSLTDMLYAKLNVECDLEPDGKDGKVKNSLELSECMENYNSSKDLVYELSHVLFNGYVNLCNVEEATSVDQARSVMEEKRWRTKQNKCDEALVEIVPLVSYLDRNSVSLDYFSTLRTMARSEVFRASNNKKRKNRFYNYLRGIGVNCNDSFFQTACNIFQNNNL